MKIITQRTIQIAFLILFGIFIDTSLYAIKIHKVSVIGNAHTSNTTILAIAHELNNSKKDYTQKQLNKLLNRIKSRLKRTTWFYYTNIHIANSKEGDQYKNIIIEVSDGLLERYGGGSIFGKYGKVNLKGGGGYLISELGINRQMVYFGDDIVFNKFHYNVAIGNINTEMNVQGNHGLKTKDFQNLMFMAKAGYKLNFDTHLNAGMQYNKVFLKNYNYFDDYYSYIIEGKYDARGEKYFLRETGVLALFEYQFIAPYNISQYTIDLRKYILLINKLTLSTRGIVRWQNTIHSPDYLKLSMADINGIRTGNIDQMTGSAFTGMSFELRWDYLQTYLPPIFNIQLQNAVFFDIGETGSALSEIKGNNYIYAYGFALRAFLESPIYLPIRFEFAQDSEGAFKFFFDLSVTF